jgi:hypothetical protein
MEKWLNDKNKMKLIAYVGLGLAYAALAYTQYRVVNKK